MMYERVAEMKSVLILGSMSRQPTYLNEVDSRKHYRASEKDLVLFCFPLAF